MTRMACDDDYVQAIAYAGAAVSTAGYSLVVATAVTFQEWRSKVANQVWLYMCGFNLIFIYFLSFYGLCKCNHLNVSWMDSDVGHSAFWVFADYSALATCSWVVAGAWLAHKRILAAMNADFERPPLGVCMFALLIPMPFCLVRAFFMRAPNPLESTQDMFPLMYQLLMVTEKVFCIALYSRILYEVNCCNRDYGRKNLVATSVLALVFLVFSGLQYLMVMIINIFFERSSPPDAVLFRSMVVLVMFGVCFYSIIIFGIKDTRMLWMQFVQSKLKIIC